MERNLSRNIYMNFGMDQGGGGWQYNHVVPIKTSPPTAPAQHLSFLPSVAGLKMGREAPGLLSPRPSWAGASSPGCGEGQVPLSLVTQISGLDKHTSPEHTHWECLPIGPQASFPQQAHHSSQLCGLFEVPSFSQHQGCLST